jgi:hypothetical protein
MSLGYLSLTSIGSNNFYISGSPEITYFKTVYKKHSNFMIQNVKQEFQTVSNFNENCTISIGRDADLLHKLTLFIELPSIMIVDEISRNFHQKFCWVNKIGLALIDFVEIEIGGIVIERLYGDWLNIWHQVNMKNDKKQYDKMIGNNIQINEFTSTKDSYKLYIPLSFWFCENYTQALPLISLTNTDIKINVKFNNLENCYKLYVTHYITVENNYCLFEENEIISQNETNSCGYFVYFDKVLRRIYYRPIKGKFFIPTTNEVKNLRKIIGKKTLFQAFIQINSIVVKIEDYIENNRPSLLSSYILGDFIFLTDTTERNKFIRFKQEYIIPTVIPTQEIIVNSRNYNYKLSLTDPVKIIFWRFILTINKEKDKFNYTLKPLSDKYHIIKKCSLLINSKNRLEVDSPEFYSSIQNDLYNLSSYDTKGIYSISFSLNPTNLQPSGTLNFTELNSSMLKLSLDELINHQNPVSIILYAIRYQIIKIEKGILRLID